MPGELYRPSDRFSLLSALCCPPQDKGQDQTSAEIDRYKFYPVISSDPSQAVSSEENKDKKSLESRLEEIKAIATNVENPNILSAISNILEEVKKSLGKPHSINFSEINAKLDHVSNMVTLANNIKDLLETNDNSAPSIPGEVRQGEGISQEKMVQIIDMSMKLYDIFANNDDLFQEIAEIFLTDEGLRDINRQKEDLREVAKKLKAAENTTKDNKIKEHLIETSDFLKKVVKSNDSTFTGAVHAAIHNTVNQRQIIKLEANQAKLEAKQVELEAKQAEQDARQAELEAKQAEQEIELKNMRELLGKQPATSTKEARLSEQHRDGLVRI